jgi:hypothetical protein
METQRRGAYGSGNLTEWGHPEDMRRWDNIFKIDIHMMKRYGLDLFCAGCSPIEDCREHHNKPLVSLKGNKFHGWVTIDFKDGVYRLTHAAYRVQLEQQASTLSVSLIADVKIMNWKFFFRRRNKEQIKSGECLLTFGPDCFIFPSAIKRRKLLNHNFTCYLQGLEMLSLIPKECTY